VAISTEEVPDDLDEGPTDHVTYFWDFFGPHSAETAQHFDRHLGEFLKKHGIAGCETGVESEGEGHTAAFCKTPPEACAAIERALRPRRRR
jgi:hypothetical protein